MMPGTIVCPDPLRGRERAVTDLAAELGYQWASSLLAYVPLYAAAWWRRVPPSQTS